MEVFEGLVDYESDFVLEQIETPVGTILKSKSPKTA